MNKCSECGKDLKNDYESLPTANGPIICRECNGADHICVGCGKIHSKSAITINPTNKKPYCTPCLSALHDARLREAHSLAVMLGKNHEASVLAPFVVAIH